MKILGIIAEYNPFHNGHKYHINEAKAKSGADFVVVIMSGSFTQQGNIAVLNKFDRATLAIENGADLIIELPTIYATSSSERFCYGAINILNSLNCITHLAFGAECSDILLLQNISKTLIEKEKEIISITKKYLSKGITSAKARDLALKDVLKDKEYLEISKPNNILGIEYLKSLSSLNSNICPVIIKRIGAGHNDLLINDTFNIASATSIRNIINEGKSSISKIKPYVPNTSFEMLTNKNLSTNKDLFEILRYEILKLGTTGLSKIYEVAEGLENRIYSSINESTNYNELVSNIKSKRYTLGRIKRILIYILLGITTDIADELSKVQYVRILKVSSKGKKILKTISNSSRLPVLSNISSRHTKGLNSDVLSALNFDLTASRLLCMLCGSDLNIDYTNLIDN